MEQEWTTHTPSITAWKRLEPSVRSNDLMHALAAPVHDPLWLAFRQWQLGELDASDSGSAAWVEVTTAELRARTVVRGKDIRPFEVTTPLESVLGEPLTLHLGLRAELGQLFEGMLREGGLGSSIAGLRAAYPIAAPTAADEGSGDAEALRAQSVLAGRVIDGGSLYTAARSATTNFATQVRPLLQKFVAYVTELLGGDPRSEPPAWKPSQLEYELDVIVPGAPRALAAAPRGNAELRWETFRTSPRAHPIPDAQPVRRVTTVLPAGVELRGNPSSRFWDFDAPSRNFGAVDVERSDSAKLAVFDLLLDPRDDWYVVPVDQEYGTLMTMEMVVVRDVFGGWTRIPAAAVNNTAWQPFSMFPSGRFLVPSGADALQYGEPIEVVRFARDEMLDTVWAIEDTVEGGLGQPLRGRDRSAARAPEAPSGTAPPSVYQLRQPVPEHWFPYVPVAAAADGVQYERVTTGPPSTAPAPAGRILLSGKQSRIAEQELRRSLRVSRVPVRCRDARGGTLLWVMRRKETGSSTDAPAAHFDALVSPP